MSKKILVAYFSASGITAKAAKALADACGGDLFEIRPLEPYTRKDLDCYDKTSRSSLEMADPSIRPEVASKVENMEQYDTVFVGFPIWCYVEPRIVDTFLDSYDFTGKTMIPFATSGGSGIEGSEKSLKKHYPNLAWEKAGLLTHADIPAWAKSVLGDWHQALFITDMLL